MKMNWKSALALLLSVGVLVSAVGCGDKENSGKGSKENSASEEDPKSKLRAYYKDLASEYEEYGDKCFKNICRRQNGSGMMGGKVFASYIGNSINYKYPLTIYSYDIESKETKVIFENQYDSNNDCYCY